MTASPTRPAIHLHTAYKAAAARRHLRPPRPSRAPHSFRVKDQLLQKLRTLTTARATFGGEMPRRGASDDGTSWRVRLLLGVWH
ncbi:hypothetical protein HYQ44_017400 [Verticillium longisporum]|nr:hypothetical protein HYQ44_017400 [Verticillium longisporum]